MKRVIFHIPHDGNEFPMELMKSVVVAPEVFARYHATMRDTDATHFAPPLEGAEVVRFETSRLLCDVERFLGEDEIMERYGMGFCYERVYDGTVIKQVDEELRAATYKLYKAHHDRIDSLVGSSDDPVLFVDLHSFSREIIVHRQVDALSDVCIGFDGYLPAGAPELIVSEFEAQGFTVALNEPYSGSFVPNCVLTGRSETPIVSFMVEVNKTAYRKQRETDPNAVKRIQTAIARVIEKL